MVLEVVTKVARGSGAARWRECGDRGRGAQPGRVCALSLLFLVCKGKFLIPNCFFGGWPTLYVCYMYVIYVCSVGVERRVQQQLGRCCPAATWPSHSPTCLGVLGDTLPGFPHLHCHPAHTCHSLPSFLPFCLPACLPAVDAINSSHSAELSAAQASAARSQLAAYFERFRTQLAPGRLTNSHAYLPHHCLSLSVAEAS